MNKDGVATNPANPRVKPDFVCGFLAENTSLSDAALSEGDGGDIYTGDGSGGAASEEKDSK